MKYLFIRILPLLVLFSSGSSLAHGADNYRRAKPFIDGMLNMMDAMGIVELEDYQGWNDHDFDRPRRTRIPGMLAPGRFPSRRLSPNWSPTPASPLENIWQGRSGEILVIRDGRYRVYASRDKFTDGLLRTRGNTLLMHNPRTDTTNKYEYAVRQGQLVLRDAQGRLMLYRRLTR